MDGGLLGGGVRGVDDNRPLGATAVFAAGLVPLAAAIPGVEHADKVQSKKIKSVSKTHFAKSVHSNLFQPTNGHLFPHSLQSEGSTG